MKIVSAVVPEGWKEWSEKANQTIKDHPEVFNTPAGEVAHEGGKHLREIKAGLSFVTTKAEQEYEEREDEWDREKYTGGELEGIRSAEARKDQETIGAERPGSDFKTVKWEPEPILTIDQ